MLSIGPRNDPRGGMLRGTPGAAEVRMAEDDDLRERAVSASRDDRRQAGRELDDVVVDGDVHAAVVRQGDDRAAHPGVDQERPALAGSAVWRRSMNIVPRPLR